MALEHHSEARGTKPAEHPAYRRVAAAAAELNERRERWLNPPEWIEPLAAKVDAADSFSDVPQGARPLLRHSAIMALAAKDSRLKKRTLTNLYNERPTRLKLAHETLDRAVLACYAATNPEGGWQEDWAKVWTEGGAGQPLPKDRVSIRRSSRTFSERIKSGRGSLHSDAASLLLNRDAVEYASCHHGKRESDPTARRKAWAEHHSGTEGLEAGEPKSNKDVQSDT